MSRTFKDRRPRDEDRDMPVVRTKRPRRSLQDVVKAHKASGDVDFTLDWED